VRRTVRDQLEYVELTHDYLAAHVDELAGWVRTIWPRRVIRWAIQGNWHTSRDALEDVVELVLADPGILATAEESASLLQFALGSGMHVAVARELLELARTRGADTVHVVAHALEGEPESARGAVELIVADAGPELLTLLRAALARDDDVAGHAVEVLSGIETSYSVELLARALGIGALVQGAELALASLAASRRDADVARDAAKTLISHLAHDETDAGDLAPALGRIQHPFAVAPLAGLLGEAEGPARGALFRLARSPSPEVADAARAALLSHLADALPEVPPHVIDELGELEDEATVAFLARAVAHPPLAAPARQALARLYRSRKLDVASAAEDVLARTPAVQAPRVPTRPLAPAPAPAPAPVTPSDEPLGSSMPSSSHFEILGRRLLEGRVVLFTGAGVNLTGVPSATGSYLPSGRELAAELASSFAYPSYEADDLLRVSQYVSVVAGSAALYDKLRTLLDVDAPLTAVHGVLASLPARMRHRAPETAPVFMTTNFDDMLERALDQAREPYHVIRYQSEGLDRGRWLHVDPSGTSRIVERPNEYGTLDSASTVIVKLAGSVDRSNPDGDSYVITEDDYVGYLAATDVSAMLPASVGERLMRSHFLFLGYSLRDWNLRVVLQRLLGKERRHYKSWAVMTHADRVDQQLWRERDVEIIDAPLEEYAHELSRHLDATAEATW